MDLSLNWLNDFVNTDGISVKEFCDGMTDSGSKVESFELLGEDIQNVVVGKIVEITKHPDSDHLQICQLDDGEDSIRQIVTGAQNVFVGAIVPVAKAPAKLPGDVTIKAGKLRGVESNGMLCSIGELGLTEHDMPGSDNSGIFILNNYIPSDTALGTDIRDALMLNDAVVEFEITSNRPDCLSVIGLAREAKVTFGRPMTLPTPKVKEYGGNVNDYISVDRHKRQRPLLQIRRPRRQKRENSPLSPVDENETARRRRPSDKQHRRYNKLRYARIRSADARL